MARVFDLHHNCYAEVALESQAITTDTTTSGEIIDTKDFAALEFVLLSATLTDGAYEAKIFQSDDAAMSGAVEVTGDELLGTATFAASDDNAVKRIGTIGKLRYQQLRVVSTSTSTGGTLAAVAVKARPKSAPTDEN